MTKNSFTEQDKEKIIEYLNFVAKHAKFNINTEEVINYYKHLSYIQSTILPKINDNILEIQRVVEPDQNESDSEDNKE